jgi:N-acetylglucosamine kinase-like BadF-type ATPase
MSLYLCVDCGGTKTAAAISDASGTVVGRGSAGPSNITYLTVNQFISAIADAVGTALKQIHPSIAFPPTDPEHRPFAAAWFGISGADSPAAIANVEEPLAKIIGIPVGPDLVIANDTHLLAAPLRLRPDVKQLVAVIAGTGSIAVSFKEVDGKIAEVTRVGGWGWILGDEGGGYDVGRETLRQILLLQDKSTVHGGPSPKSQLITRILQRFGVASIMELFGVVYFPDPIPSVVGQNDAPQKLVREKRISSLPPLVFEAAFEGGDPLALNVLKTTANKLASQIAMLLGEGAPSSAANVVEAPGSLISFGGSLVRDTRYRDIAQRGYVFKHVFFIDDVSATGACESCESICPVNFFVILVINDIVKTTSGS